MSYYRDKCLQLYERQLREYFTTWNDSEARAKRAEKILNAEAFAHINELPHARAVNEFIGQIVEGISKEVFDEKLEGVIQLILSDMSYVLDNLFDEPEMTAIYAFASSELGQKLLRNLDLLGDSYQKGSIILTTEIVGRWSRPEVANRIAEYLMSLEDGEQPPH